MKVLEINGLEVKPAPTSGIYKIKFSTSYGLVEGIFEVKASKGYKYVAREIKKAGDFPAYTPKKYRSLLTGTWMDVKE